MAVALRHLGGTMAKQSADLIKRGALFHMPAGKRVAQAVKDDALPPIRIAVIEAKLIDAALEEFRGLNAPASGVCRKDKLISGLTAEAPAQHGTNLSGHVGITIVPVLGIADKDFSSLETDVTPAQRVDFSSAQPAEKRQQAGVVQILGTGSDGFQQRKRMRRLSVRGFLIRRTGFSPATRPCP